MDNRPIGVFDSGLGGLTVVKEIINNLPNEDIIYFGDTARIPYGTRSNETVIRYSKQCANFLLSKKIKMIVVACNTVSSIGIDALREELEIPIVGVIEPGAKEAVSGTKNKLVGVIGTQGTIRSKAYDRAITLHDASIRIFATPCTLFVPIVEEDWSHTRIALLTAERYLGSMKDKGVDTLILGCTHFPLLQDTIGKIMGPNVKLINPARGTATEVERILRNTDMLNKNKDKSEYNFFVSDLGEKFQEVGGRFLGREIKHAPKIDIEEY